MNLDVLNSFHDDKPFGKVTRFQIIQDNTVSEIRIGVDIGYRNMGIAVLRPNKGDVAYQIRLRDMEDELDRMLTVQQAIGSCIGYFDLNAQAIVEGASHGRQFRQVQLSEARAAAVLWFWQHDIKALVIPPKKARKSVLGDGRKKGSTVWEDRLPPDAADALVLALYEKD